MIACMHFEWDENKERINREKHGFSFDDARQAFDDPDKVITKDFSHSTREERFFCYGEVNGKILTVRFTIRGNRTRIIGAGDWREGRKIYEEENQRGV